jgi:hypothetical protein
MAAYHKVEVSLNTNAVEVGIPSPQSVTVTVPTVGPVGPQGPAGPKGDPGEVSGSIAWDNVTDKPASFTPSSHTHVAADVTDFNAAVAAVAPPTTDASLLTSGTLNDARLSSAVTASLGNADTASQPGHTHVAADITDFTSAVEAVSPPADWDTLANKPASFTPSAHASTHHTGGADALAAHQINGQTIFSTGTATYSTDQTLPANRARQLTISNTNAGGINITLPTGTDGTLVGDTYVVIGGGTVSGPITVRRINVLSPLIYETLATITATGQQHRFRASGGSTGGWSLVPVDTHTHSANQITGLATVATTGDYDDLTDKPTIPSASSATPSALGAAAAGSSNDYARADHIHALPYDQSLNTTDSVLFANLETDSNVTVGGDLNIGNAINVGANGIAFTDGGDLATIANLGLGTAATADSTDFAAASHTHGNLTNEGKVGSTSGLPLVTTTAGAVTTLALGTANQVLKVNSGATGVEFGDASGGVTAIGASAADILSVSGSDIVADDLGADKLWGWDDSESKAIGYTIGSGLSVSGDTLSATASGGSKTYAVFTAQDNQPPSTNFATLDTRNSIAVLDFDDATDESAVFVGIIPEGASLGSGLKIRLHWMATTATSNNCVWDVSLERMTTDLDSDSFDTIASATASANGTSGILTVTEITLTTIDSVTAGDGYRLKVTRDANNGSDNMSGDAELVAVEVRSAA